jgi:GNAT superfamily N-acetyltransferase
VNSSDTQKSAVVEDRDEPSSQAADLSDIGTTVRVCRTVADIEEIRPFWASWKGYRDSDIDFYLEFIRTRQEVLRPHVIVLSRDGRPDALLIGRLEKTRIDSKIGYLRLPAVPARILTFAYGGLRGNASEENCIALVRSIMDSLRRGEADLAFLHKPGEDDLVYKRALSLPSFWCRDHLTYPESHHVMKLAENIEQVYQGFSHGLRGQLRRKQKKVLKEFNGLVKVTCFRDASELDRIIAEAEVIAKKTYQRGLGVGFEDTPAMRGRLNFCAEKGWLRAGVLYIGDRPCAFWIGTVYDGVFVSDFLAFDPEFRDYSLGSYLLIAMIEEFCKEGTKAVDFGFGPGEYKERFGNSELREASVHIFAPNFKGLTLNALRTVTVLVESTLKKSLQKTNLLPKIKRLWRERVSQKPASS